MDDSKLIMPGTLKQSDYEPVGSWLPLAEYVNTFDIIEQFLGEVDGLPNIPRKIRAYDAVTMCSVEPMGILTVMLVPRKFSKDIHPALHPQSPRNSSYDVMLINNPQPFDSFRHPGWPWKYVDK